MSTQSPFQGVVKDYGIHMAAPFDSQLTQATPVLTNALDQESLVYWLSTLNSNAGGVAPLASDGNGNKFMGVCLQQAPVYTYNNVALSPNPGTNNVTLTRKCRFKAKVTVGSSYSPLGLVYAGADAQTLAASGSNAIGFVAADQAVITSAVSGQYVEAELEANYQTAFLG